MYELLSRNARSNKCNPQLANKLFFERRILTQESSKKFHPPGEIQTHNPLSTRQKVTNLASNLQTFAAKENIRSPEYDEAKLIYHLVNNAGQQPPSLIIFGVVFAHLQGSSNSVQFSLFPSIFHSVFAEVNHFTFIVFV